MRSILCEKTHDGQGNGTHLARPLCAAAAPTGAAPWYTSSSAISGSAVLRLPVPPDASFGPAAGLNCSSSYRADFRCHGSMEPELSRKSLFMLRAS